MSEHATVRLNKRAASPFDIDNLLYGQATGARLGAARQVPVYLSVKSQHVVCPHVA